MIFRSSSTTVLALHVLAVLPATFVQPQERTSVEDAPNAHVTMFGNDKGVEPTKELQAKAAFLSNFPRYVRWPADAFERGDSPLVVAVVGKDPFGPLLDRALSGRSIGRHPLVIRRFRDVSELEPCHLLFVPEAEGARAQEIAAHYKGRPTLLVGDSEGFVDEGGLIGFFLDDKRVRFAINTDAVDRTGIEISSQLLKLARIVRDKERRR